MSKNVLIIPLTTLVPNKHHIRGIHPFQPPRYEDISGWGSHEVLFCLGKPDIRKAIKVTVWGYRDDCWYIRADEYSQAQARAKVGILAGMLNLLS